MRLPLEQPAFAPAGVSGALEIPVSTARVQPAWRKMVAVLRAVVLWVVAFLIFGNLLILGLSAWAKATTPDFDAVLPGVSNMHQVDEQVWRGAAPGAEGYASLADAGVRTIVDLRAEDDLEIDTALLDDLGLEYVHIPIRDGQVPNQDQVDRFLAAVDDSAGPVFLHCGAGVGRTGAMAAAYLTATGQSSALGALRRNLSVGPPSLEQIAFAANLEGGHVDKPNAAVVAFSRVLDAPRRLWSRFGL